MKHFIFKYEYLTSKTALYIGKNAVNYAAAEKSVAKDIAGHDLKFVSAVEVSATINARMKKIDLQALFVAGAAVGAPAAAAPAAPAAAAPAAAAPAAAAPAAPAPAVDIDLSKTAEKAAEKAAQTLLDEVKVAKNVVSFCPAAPAAAGINKMFGAAVAGVRAAGTVVDSLIIKTNDDLNRYPLFTALKVLNTLVKSCKDSVTIGAKCIDIEEGPTAKNLALLLKVLGYPKFTANDMFYYDFCAGAAVYEFGSFEAVKFNSIFAPSCRVSCAKQVVKRYEEGEDGLQAVKVWAVSEIGKNGLYSVRDLQKAIFSRYQIEIKAYNKNLKAAQKAANSWAAGVANSAARAAFIGTDTQFEKVANSLHAKQVEKALAAVFPAPAPAESAAGAAPAGVPAAGAAGAAAPAAGAVGA